MAATIQTHSPPLGQADRGRLRGARYPGAVAAFSPEFNRTGRLALPVALGLWTLFVWGGRLRNLWSDPGGLGAAPRWSLIASLLFTVLGLTVLAAVGTVAAARRTGRSSLAGETRSVLGAAVATLAVVTVAVWVIRGIDIAAGDHPLGFILVHVVLAVVSIGLAGAAARSVLGLRPDRDDSVERSEPGRSPVG